MPTAGARFELIALLQEGLSATAPPARFSSSSSFFFPSSLALLWLRLLLASRFFLIVSVSRPPLPGFLVGPGPASSFYPGSWLFPSARPSWVSGGGQSGYPGLQESAGLAKIGLPSRTLSPSHPLVCSLHLLLSWSPRPRQHHFYLAVCHSKESPRSMPYLLVVVV